MSRILRAAQREDGIALVTAILVSAIVLLMSMSAVAISIHNTDASGYDKRRLEAIDAAEAGIDYYYYRIGSTSLATLATASLPSGYSIVASTCRITGTTNTNPTATFVVTPTFYATSSSSTAYTCAQYSTMLAANPTGPWYVELLSTATAAGQTTPTRTMRSRARLTAISTQTTFPAAAIYGSSSVNLSANVQAYGNGSNNANVYSNGNISVTTASNIKGSMYVQGTATVANGNFQLAGDLWAKNGITVSGGKIGHDAISSTSTITLTGNTKVYNNAKAGSSISVTNPASIAGTQSPNTTGIANPPSLTYPTYSFSASDWPGYVSQASCANALTAISNWTTGNLYIRLTGCASFSMPSKVLPGNLAILTDGTITFPVNTYLTTNSSSVLSIYLFTGLTGTCGNFTTAANSGIGKNLKALIYTPSTCSATIQSNSWNASGQVFSGSITFSSNTSVTYAPVDLPAVALDSASLLVDIVYKRETFS
jgi:hypothetical protein